MDEYHHLSSKCEEFITKSHAFLTYRSHKQKMEKSPWEQKKHESRITLFPM